MIETVDVKHTKSRGNVFHVPVREWKKWSIAGRQVFNEVYSSMRYNQKLFLHPKQTPPSKDHWGTTAWNAAWTAAKACAGNVVIETKVYADGSSATGVAPLPNKSPLKSKEQK